MGRLVAFLYKAPQYVGNSGVFTKTPLVTIKFFQNGAVYLQEFRVFLAFFVKRCKCYAISGVF